MLKFVIKSHTFKRMLILTLFFFAVVWLSNILFDKIWTRTNSFPVTNLDEVYMMPRNYNNLTQINLKLAADNKVAIEGNKRLRVSNKKNYDYYDTVTIEYPKNTYDYTNKIFLEFENSKSIDSIYFVVSNSDAKDLYWKQIFLSTVKISNLNEFSSDTASYRIKAENLTDTNLLTNNDTLINSALNFFNSHKDSLQLSECGTNCLIFQSICNKFNLPSRIIGLQGGDANFGGLDNIGYPLHVVCEVYSSLAKKWYVIDPTYGFRYKEKNSNEFMNAAEISNKLFFMSEKDIIQDSVLFTKRSVLGRDYFKYYDNVYIKSGKILNYFFGKFLHIFFGKFNYKILHYSNNVKPIKNSFYYLALKSSIYLVLSLIYFNLILFFLTRRLFSVKKPVK